MYRLARLSDPEYDATAILRFFELVVVPENPTDCWIWIGHLVGKGYGHFSYKNKQILSHRFLYEWFHGPIPIGVDLLHSCDVTFCVNPIHLSVGTRLENIQDCVRKGRKVSLHSEKHPNHKLHEEDVLAIRRLYDTSFVSTRFLARRFGVSQNAIMNVIQRKTWANIYEP